jgi:hypothetical protein
MCIRGKRASEVSEAVGLALERAKSVRGVMHLSFHMQGPPKRLIISVPRFTAEYFPLAAGAASPHTFSAGGKKIRQLI